MRHTKGPWKRSDRAWRCIAATTPPRHTICVMQNMHREDCVPNAERIVACVNGCDAAGVENPKELQTFLNAADGVMGMYRLGAVVSAMQKLGESAHYDKTIREFTAALAKLRV